MKKFPLALFSASALCVLMLAAANPDFSGTWIRNQTSSDPLATRSSGGIQPVTADLTVRQEGNSLQVETRWSHRPATQKNYLLDGSENTISGGREGNLVYRATWAGDNLIIEGIQKADTPFGPAEMKIQEEWSISADGKILTITTSVSSKAVEDQTRKQVYNKQSP
jgi:hypothetical protein